MSKIKDPSLSPRGEESYHWAYSHMPALVKTIERLTPNKPLNGMKVGVCLHVTKETSVLVLGLKKLGADVHLAAANPLSTQDEIAAFLMAKGIDVYAWKGETSSEYMDCIRDVIRTKPEIVMDDGADTHVVIHEEFKALKVLGGTEETTTGVIRLRALERAGLMKYPVIAVNNALSKYLFDNRYGTGQSTIDGILRATSLLLAGKTVVVSGYGWVGKGIARRARGLDARVIVTEVDPHRALEAHLDGFQVLPITDAAKVGDLFITATGQTGVIRWEHMESMKAGAILANAGHFDVEIDVKALDENKKLVRTVRPNLEEFMLNANGKKLYLVGKGRIANLVAAEGHPPEVMMMSFSNQLLAAIYVAENQEKLQPKLLYVPEEIDKEVARNALEGFGVTIDMPTEEQRKYALSWQIEL